MRFGSAELYDVIDLCFAPEATHGAHTVADCLAVGQSVAQGTDERVVLFVKLLEGEALSDELERRRALYKFNIWNTGADSNFDRIVLLAKLVFSTKGVKLSLLDCHDQCVTNWLCRDFD